MRVQTIRIKPSHPAYQTAVSQLVESRRLHNTLNALAHESDAYSRNPDADTHIAQELELEQWVQNKKFLGNYVPFEIARKTVEQKLNISLPQKVAQHIAREVAYAWKSYYALRKINNRAGKPRYKKTYGILQYTKQAISLVKQPGYLTPSGWAHGIKLPDYIDTSLIQAARVLVKNSEVYLEIIHKTPKDVEQTTGSYNAAIDFGVDQLVTLVVDKPGYRPKTISGKPIKAVNQFANKQAAVWRAKLDQEAYNIWNKLDNKEEVNKGKISSKGLDRLWGKRHRRINHYLNSASNALVKELAQAGVKNLVIGWSDGFKHNTSIGKRNNQNFVQIPHAKLRDMLIRKAQQAGIIVQVQEESYTSKASFLDEDKLPVHGASEVKPVFSGRRITRGQYRASTGQVIHADVNAAWNILKKSNLPMREARGIIVMPQRLSFNH